MADTPRHMSTADNGRDELRQRSSKYSLIYRSLLAVASSSLMVGLCLIRIASANVLMVGIALAICVGGLLLYFPARHFINLYDKAERALRITAPKPSALRSYTTDYDALPSRPWLLIRADDIEQAAHTTASDLRALLSERFGSGATYERYAAGVTRAEASVAAEFGDVHRLAGSFGQDALGRACDLARQSPDRTSTAAIDVAARSALDALRRADATTQAMQRLYVSLLTSDNPTDDVAGELDALSEGLSAYGR